MASLIEGQVQLRSNQIGQQAIANMEEALRRNYEIGITDGLKLIPKIVVSTLQNHRERYTALLMKDRGEDL